MMGRAMYVAGLLTLWMGPAMLHAMGITPLKDTIIITTWAGIYGAFMAASEFFKK
jgi:hypothetical protein